MNKRALISLLCSLVCLTLFAQRSEEQIKSDIHHLGNIYVPYPDTSCVCTRAPKGYKPFFVTHLGRHGTRYRGSEEEYLEPLLILRKADSLGVLTDAGKNLLKDVQAVYDDAWNRWGQLVPKGYREHRHIIDRLCTNYPEIFKSRKGQQKKVEAISTDVMRTAHSMAAGMGELGRLYPELEITMESSTRTAKSFFARARQKKIEKATKPMQADYKANTHFENFNARVFTDDAFLGDGRYKLMKDIWALAPTAEGSDVEADLWSYLTVEECYPLWAQRNMYMYLTFGPSEEYGNYTTQDLYPLTRRMIESADEAIAGSDVAGTFHYAHDVHVIPLAVILGIKGSCESATDLGHISEAWCDYVITPMTCNIQMVFFRKNKSDDILVKVLQNEREATLCLDTDCWPFYHWSELKPYIESRMKQK